MSHEVGTKKVLVTGGGTGIGRAVAEALLRAGGRVVVTGRRVEVLESLAAQWPGQAFALPCDLASPEARDGLLRRAAEVLGGLDGFVHSAGQVVHQPPGHIGEEALRAQLEVNLVAPLRLGEQALEVLEPGGAQVFIASTLATRPVVTSAVYSAAKAGLLQVMKVLALAGAARGVRASAVLPGVVETDMVREVRLAPGEEPLSESEALRRQEAQLAGLRALHPLGRLGRPEDVAEAVRYLLGASWLSGSELVLDGGLLLRE
ncbi:SDR family oxidoreductase [Comamonas sp. JC664]|uniref:SDR family NAD(P)-dependent oxidoreductase n=1 Tax=Comamonas sp. JC664 TaxID=2801917 RepID=UPI00174BECF5|nr:SDR family oxidoreductase [Comamonas sp. JC664]MBL0699030.1 SDR family oxidoreductase [Comamonas sp. JC664]GHG80116.1 short-chain dehydrogenase [Comamonas sp. KCTC 72670]